MNHEDLYISIYFLLDNVDFFSHVENIRKLWGNPSFNHLPQERLDLRSRERIDDGFRVARTETGEASC